jgi:GNAT superfamily N-acetyltransferase
MNGLTLRPVDYGHPDVALLEQQVQLEYARRYGGGDDTVLHPEQFREPEGVFLLLSVDGVATAMGGWRARESDGANLRDGDAEIKRMYVVPAAQRRGYARTLLVELERTASLAGRWRMVLETGVLQPEAIALYTSSGYTEIGKFGLYSGEEASRCYAKVLTG